MSLVLWFVVFFLGSYSLSQPTPPQLAKQFITNWTLVIGGNQNYTFFFLTVLNQQVLVVLISLVEILRWMTSMEVLIELYLAATSPPI